MLSKHITLIIKVTNSCDMGCRYCFIEPAVYSKTMKVEIAQRLIRTFLDSKYFEAVNFVWHGGEPLLRGMAFFEELLVEQRSRPTQVRYQNSVQTNATRLDDPMLEFLDENDFHIGLSLDGPKRLNDNVRLLSIDQHPSAHDITVDAANRLQARGRAAGAIVVVNANNVQEPEVVYQEFKSHGIHMKINPLMRSGLAAASGADLGITAEQYGAFAVRLFNVWFDDPEPTIGIDPFENHIARLLRLAGAMHECHFARSCHESFLGIAPDGDIYPCGMFQGEPAFRYGNIAALTPEEVHTTAVFERIAKRELDVLQTCSNCDFYEMCYSGCMFHSLKNANRFEEKDYYCKGYKMYFENLVRKVHGELTRAAAKLPASGT